MELSRLNQDEDDPESPAPDSAVDDDVDDTTGLAAADSLQPAAQPKPAAQGKSRHTTWLLPLGSLVLIFSVVLVALSVGAGGDSGGGDGDDWRARFAAVPDAASARESLAAYAAAPSVAGTAQDYALAEYTRDRWLGLGIDAKIERYEVLLSYPLERSVTVTGADGATVALGLEEAEVEGDACTSDPTRIPTYNGYSPSGAVAADVVYLNYGTPDDMQTALAMGVELEGKIALVRYGHLFRGLKGMVGEEYGIAGVLIFSDPADDGFVRGDVYPDGPWRPETSVQRGSVQYLSRGGGDPLSVGWASTPDMPRRPFDDVNSDGYATIPSIPMQPISYGDAQLILERMDGVAAPEEWQGGLELEYRVTGVDTQVDLNLSMNFTVGSIWNVIGTIPGREEPDRAVVLGNHRDAWVCGAIDPHSGSASLMEVARGFGELLAAGWQPRRTLVLASWDAEEFGLVGSSEWVEEHLAELQASAVAYLNLDDNVGVLAGAAASPSLAQLMLQEAGEVEGPALDGSSLLAQWEAGAEASIGSLGSGSDFTPFYQYAGVASVDLGMRGEHATYHSSMDSFEWLANWSDPTFEGLRAAAEWWGRAAMRLTDDAVLPFVMADYADALAGFVDELEERLAGEGDLSGLRAAVAEFAAAAADLDDRAAAAADLDDVLAQRRVNDRLMLTERALLGPGLELRPWYKHTVFAPGYYAGYEATRFPPVTDVLDQGGYSEGDLAAAIFQVTTRVHGAALYMGGTA